MFWLMIALVILLAFFAWRVFLPAFFGAVIGAAVFLIAPLFRFDAAPELIMFCGAAGLIFGLGRVVLFGGGE